MTYTPGVFVGVLVGVLVTVGVAVGAGAGAAGSSPHIIPNKVSGTIFTSTSNIISRQSSGSGSSASVFDKPIIIIAELSEQKEGTVRNPGRHALSLAIKVGKLVLLT
jgi:hypothetical protein